MDFKKIVNYLYTGCDSTGLAFIRIIFGVLMMIDIMFERGLSRADEIWGDANECRFPLFDSLKVLPLRWMFFIYTVMFVGAFGMTVGFRYRLSCSLYLIPYWYLILLDKSRWNNHSYLFGLFAFLLSFCDANKKWSFDQVSNELVPFWQYFLLRSQLFLVYFIAGLKKMDNDWLNGYSMTYLSEHWIFDIFRFFIANDTIDYIIVHWFGFLFDLTIGFFLIINKTRKFAFVICLSFHVMNSQLFSIGMFPYVMIATMPLFASPNWPILVLNSIKSLIFRDKKLTDRSLKIKKLNDSNLSPTTRKQKMTLALIFLYLLIQIILPYSHWVTKGYNTWTHGLYGYSWDMMVHSWRNIHTRITVVDNVMNTKFYLKPDAWTKGSRWTHHADMVKQFSSCAKTLLLRNHNITDPSIYMDTWVSLNGRFAQRMYNPKVDIIKATWSPFQRPSWVLPLLTHLTDWQQKLKQLEDSLFDNNNAGVIFIADFPGLSLNNYVEPQLGNTTLHVLKGWIKVEISTTFTRIMTEGDTIQMPSNMFHKITAIKSHPACYMIIYSNTTHQNLGSQLSKVNVIKNMFDMDGNKDNEANVKPLTDENTSSRKLRLQKAIFKQLYVHVGCN